MLRKVERRGTEALGQPLNLPATTKPKRLRAMADDLKDAKEAARARALQAPRAEEANQPALTNDEVDAVLGALEEGYPNPDRDADEHLLRDKARGPRSPGRR